MIIRGFFFLSVVPPGFEPRLTEPKPGVLPLHHGTITIALKSGAKIKLFSTSTNSVCEFIQQLIENSSSYPFVLINICHLIRWNHLIIHLDSQVSLYLNLLLPIEPSFSSRL